MDTKFKERAQWFLETVREGNYPSANDVAKEFSVSAKTAARVITKLREDYDAPLEYNPRNKGYELSDLNFRLPCNCAKLSDEEVRVLALAASRFKESGEGENSSLMYGILKRLLL